jgi:hypothetical protein
MSELLKESDVIERWGVPKDELVAYRKETLVEGRDWERIPMGSRPIQTCPVAFTEVGQTLVFKRFGLVIGEKVAEPADKPKEEILPATVFKVGFPNRRIMQITLQDGKRAFCSVFDSTPFKPDLPIAVKYRGGRYYCEHRPTSILRVNHLINRTKNHEIP